jgi:hypothetical protein
MPAECCGLAWIGSVVLTCNVGSMGSLFGREVAWHVWVPIPCLL